MMCVMALFVNLLVVGCFALVYGTKMKYENGMLFGIHMPKEAQKDPEVQSLMPHRPVGLRQVDVPQDAEPHERLGRRLPGHWRYPL